MERIGGFRRSKDISCVYICGQELSDFYSTSDEGALNKCFSYRLVPSLFSFLGKLLPEEDVLLIDQSYLLIFVHLSSSANRQQMDLSVNGN